MVSFWSAENATNAYLNTIKMGKKANEPDVAEFISALAAGNNAQLMVVACAAASTAGSTTLGLVAAAHQTGGRVICIVGCLEELQYLSEQLGLTSDADDHVDFIVGDAQTLLSSYYREADLVVVDCSLENHEEILGTIQGNVRDHKRSMIVLGYNAFCRDSWRWSGSNTQLLPIGEGLLLTRIAGKAAKTSSGGGNSSSGGGNRSRWVVKLDKCTGEEHVFRVRSPPARVIRT